MLRVPRVWFAGCGNPEGEQRALLVSAVEKGLGIRFDEAQWLDCERDTARPAPGCSGHMVVLGAAAREILGAEIVSGSNGGLSWRGMPVTLAPSLLEACAGQEGKRELWRALKPVAEEIRR